AGTSSVTVTTPLGWSASQNGILTAPGVPAQLFIVQQPTNSFASWAFNPVVTVRADDAYGNPIQSGAAITLGLASNPTNAAVKGTKTVVMSGGLATFTGVSVSKAGVGYTLVAKAGAAISTPSTPFTIYKATHFSVSKPTAVQAGTAFTVTVVALDAFNHVDTT